MQNPQPNLYSTVLKLRNITEASEGNYSCYAKNGIGSSRDSLKITVRRNMSLIRGFTGTVSYIIYVINKRVYWYCLFILQCDQLILM